MKAIYDGVELVVEESREFETHLAHLCFNPKEPRDQHNPQWFRDDDKYLTLEA